MSVLDTIHQRLGFELREFTGANASGELPVSDAFLNRLIAGRLAGHAQIAAVRVEGRPDEAIGIEVVPRIRLMPTLRLAARIEKQPEFPHDPTLLLRWSMPAAGPLTALAGPALSHFKSLPPGVRVEGDRIAVNLRELLRARGMDDVLDLVGRLTVHTRPGGFVIRFQVGV